MADPCLPFPRIRHCVTESETDQSSIVIPRRRAAGRAAAAWIAGLAVAAVLTLGGCGDGSDDAPATELRPAAERKVEVRGTPVAIAVGAGGVWVADNANSRVVHLDPESGRPAGRPISVGRGPEAIAVGEGAVWVASGDDSVTRIDPTTGRARRASVQVADPAGIAAGEGSVWVTSGPDGTVTRIDPKTLRAEGKAIRVGGEPGDVAVGAAAVWVANGAGGTVTRIDAASGNPEGTTDVADYQVLGLTFGEGGVWIAKTDDRLARTIEVARIDPESSRVVDGAAEVAAAIPVQLAAGEGGVWVTEVGGVRPPDLAPRRGAVALVDPATAEAAPRQIPVGKRPGGVAVGKGGVWVADSGDGTVTRIDPGGS